MNMLASASTAADLDITAMLPVGKQLQYKTAIQMENLLAKGAPKPERFHELNNLLQRLRLVADADLVVRTLNAVLPPVEHLTWGQIGLCIQAFESCTQPHTLLQYFNNHIAQLELVTPQQPPSQLRQYANKRVNELHITSLFKVLANSNKAVNRQLVARSPQHTHVVLEGLEWYDRITKERERARSDVILAQSALHLASSLDYNVAKRDKRYLDKAISILQSILTGSVPVRVKPNRQSTYSSSSSSSSSSEPSDNQAESSEQQVERRGLNLSPTRLCSLYAPVIMLAGKSDAPEIALQLYNEVVERPGVGVNVIASTALMTAYNYSKNYDGAIEVYAQLVNSGQSPGDSQEEPAPEDANSQSELTEPSMEPTNAEDDEEAVQPPPHGAQAAQEESQLTRWPSERTMYHLLMACYKSENINNAAAYCEVFRNFEKWSRSKNSKKGDF
jgi:hypothetical protein